MWFITAVEEVAGSGDAITIGSVIMFIATAAIVACVISLVIGNGTKKGQPPRMPHYIPFLGNIVSFGKHPVNFIKEGAKRYGDVFTTKILNKEMTFVTHPRAYDTFFKATDDELSLREVYGFMSPVFGKGVVYDAKSTEMMMEQVRFVSSGLTTQRFHQFVDVFEEEVRLKSQKLGKSGEFDTVDTMGDLIIYTASRTLLGPSIREYLENKNLGKLYHDLDIGISPLSFFYPNLPQGIRDRARNEIYKLFSELIEKRRKNPDLEQDVLNAMLDARYKDGEKLPDSHIIGILLAGLFAGQHTSTIASSWTLLNIVNDKNIYKRVMEEQDRVMGTDPNAKLTYDKVQEMELLERCMREALRMYPPLIMLMRYVKKPRKHGDYVIPKGNVLVISPSQCGRCEDVYENPDVFDPDRFSDPRREHEKLRHGNISFGGGRHKCIGENFAILQVKSIISTILRTYDMELVDKLPSINYQSMVVGPVQPCKIRYTARKHA
jgi:sterol 14-demethylase